VPRTSPARTALAALLIALVPAAGAGAVEVEPAPVDPGPVKQAASAERISDERTLSRWGFAQRREPVRSGPGTAAPSFTRLRMTTELGSAEVYLALRRRLDDAGEPWLQVRVPSPPNGQTGWVPESALGELYVVRTMLQINLGRRRAKLFRDGRPVWSAPVAIGRRGTPTPRGRYYVRERLHLGRSGGPYGAFAFGTSAYSEKLSDWPGGGVIGIHGTNEPRLIPGRVSHGCVRLRNAHVLRLRRLMGLGTPIWIR
jgi:hypothetical protein